MEYPVLDIVSDLKRSLLSSPVTIVQAPPGAGKSTVLPLELRREPWLGENKIIMLEPRRLAAKSVAERMADSVGQNCGDEIGYRVRFESKIGVRTRVEVVTEGILTRMIQQDSSLEGVGLLIFDEFHERSIHADLALALALQVQQVLRSDLRILIMSATLDAAELSAILKGAPVITSEGRQYPVTIKYDERPNDDNPAQRAPFVIRKALRENPGDMLVFLPGAGEIKRVVQELESQELDAVLYPLYGDLPFRRQQEAILPRTDGRRKIVLATSIAETSLTIQGIKTVVDAGLSRVPRFDPRSGLTRLETTRVTRDAADQRAGRAGRLSEGVCYRMWTPGEHLFLAEKRKPEILEADLASLVLELANWGITDVDDLIWITRPPRGTIAQARDLLQQLEAIDAKGITPRGKEMLQLPTHPRIAHLLLEARDVLKHRKGILALATDVAALLEERDPLDRAAGADLTLRVEALRRWRDGERLSIGTSTFERIERVASNWRRLLKVETDNAIPFAYDVGALLWAAYPERLAKQQGKHNPRFKLLNGRNVHVAQSDSLVSEPWLCAAQVDAGASEGKVFLAAPVNAEELLRHAVEKTVVSWDDERGMVAGFTEMRIGPLLLESRPFHAIDAVERIAVVLDYVRTTGLHVLGDQDGLQLLQNRILSLYHWRKEEPWPPVDDTYLRTHLEDWLAPFIQNVSRRGELLKLDTPSMIRTLLPWALSQKLDILVPERIQVPSGSMIKVKYHADGRPPIVEVRLQEMFGLAETPAVNEGRTKVLLHLLSPGYKPVQVTQDLRSFWQTTYHEVRKELRMRYPKHHWPDDPWNAEPVRGAKRRNVG
jgi:ATP-dependent helicase HrpB